MKLNEKVKDYLWKAAYTIVFGGFGYVVMASMQQYRDNMRACQQGFDDLYERVEYLEEKNNK